MSTEQMFDCHGHPIMLPAELDGAFTQPPSFIHFHEVIEQLEPALKEIVTILSREPHTRYLRTLDPDLIIRDYVIFISRKAPSGKCYWEGYSDGPRKYSFAHWVLICFMAHLARPETKKKLQQRQQAIETKLKADRAAARKRAQAFINDPKGYTTPPTTAPASAGPEQTPRAIVDEAQAEPVRIKANAQSTQPTRNPGQPVKETIQLFIPGDVDDTHDEASVNQTIQLIRPTDDTDEA